MAAVGPAVLVRQVHVDMEIGGAAVVVADDAAGTGELNGPLQLEGVAVAVPGPLLRDLDGVAEAHMGQAADGAEDHAVVDPRLLTGLLETQQNVRARFQPQHHDPSQSALSHLNAIVLIIHILPSIFSQTVQIFKKLGHEKSTRRYCRHVLSL